MKGLKAAEPAWCCGCGVIAPPFVERRPFQGSGAKPSAKVRVCPPCFLRGWRLVGEPVERRAWREREPEQLHVVHVKESA